MSVTKEKIIDVLKQCYDPEMPIDVWNLGLIYDIIIEDTKNNDKSNVDITMTLTTPGCGMAQYIAQDVQNKVQSLNEVQAAHVELTFEPRWMPDMMTDEGRKLLGM